MDKTAIWEALRKPYIDEIYDNTHLDNPAYKFLDFLDSVKPEDVESENEWEGIKDRSSTSEVYRIIESSGGYAVEVNRYVEIGILWWRREVYRWYKCNLEGGELLPSGARSLNFKIFKTLEAAKENIKLLKKGQTYYYEKTDTPSEVCECGHRHPLIAELGKCGACWDKSGIMD